MHDKVFRDIGPDCLKSTFSHTVRDGSIFSRGIGNHPNILLNKFPRMQELPDFLGFKISRDKGECPFPPGSGTGGGEGGGSGEGEISSHPGMLAREGSL